MNVSAVLRVHVMTAFSKDRTELKSVNLDIFFSGINAEKMVVLIICTSH